LEATHSRRREVARNAGRLTVRRLREHAIAILFLLPSLVLFALFIFWPLLESVSLSVHANDIIGRPTRFVGLNQYVLMFSQPNIRQTLLNTALFTLLTVIPSIVAALALSMLLQQRIAGIGFFRTVMATPFAFSVATASVIFAIFYNPGVGVFNGLLAALHLPAVGWLTDPGKALYSVAFTTVWLQLGYNVLVLTAGLQAIPEDVYEAARLDGARGWALFRNVVLPLVTPSLFFLLVVTTIMALQSFGQIDILTKGGPAGATTTMVYSIYLNAFGYGSANFGLASAEAVVLFLVVLVVTAVQFGVLERRVFYR
jgi:sn-glycerol 3-phosphate transport system permease protein